MFRNWRIGSVNGALLAAYFIPAWTIAAFKIVTSPIHGLYERPNISLALFVSDHLQLSGMATVRVAWLLALGRMTVVAFLAVFLVFIARASIRRSGGCDEALGMALAIGSVMSFAGVLMASHDLNLSAGYSDRLMILHEGAIVAEGSAENVLRPELLQRVYGVALQRIDRPGKSPIVTPE